MKNLIKYLVFSMVLILGLNQCQEPITEFGFDAVLKGTVSNQSGDLISGDITSGATDIRALGEEDDAPMIMRLKGDGTYQNTKLYPQTYSVWLTGPFIESPTTEVDINLRTTKEVTHNFVVTPFVDCMTPVLSGSPASTISVNYSISGNGGYIAGSVRVLCSTVNYPSVSTGSGPGYTTLTSEVTNEAQSADMSGTVEFTDLESSQRYFIRIAARANGASAYNYSDQIRVDIP
jgi:muramoyltetrapeptide carboxypeptidase LdcA involved in peptidoglycan recycling